MSFYRFLKIANDLEVAGLVWHPEIGDEVANREEDGSVSILVDPQGLTPTELRSTYLWLPTCEQMLMQFEARQAILFHAGLELSSQTVVYKTVIQAPCGHIESKAVSFRDSLGIALRDLLMNNEGQAMH